MGEFVPKNPKKFRDIDRVINPKSIPEISGMLRKFGKSHIDWDLLGVSETSPISYAEGDTITQAGQTLQMVDGRWIALKSNENDFKVMTDLLHKCATPYSAFENKVSWTDADNLVISMDELSRPFDIPSWLRKAQRQVEKLDDEGIRSEFWNTGVIGLACQQVFDERAGEGISFLSEYALLSEAMQRATGTSRYTALQGEIREGIDFLAIHYSKKNGFSNVWRGLVNNEAVSTATQTTDGTFYGLCYKNRSPWVSLDETKIIYGESFDPFSDSDWCISSDGEKVIKSGDYYVGNYKDFLTRIDSDIASAPSDKIK